jgi:hypothetical protein
MMGVSVNAAGRPYAAALADVEKTTGQSVNDVNQINKQFLTNQPDI